MALVDGARLAIPKGVFGPSDECSDLRRLVEGIQDPNITDPVESSFFKCKGAADGLFLYMTASTASGLTGDSCGTLEEDDRARIL